MKTFYFVLFIVICSCQQKDQAQAESNVTKASNTIDNEYTRIVLSLCDEIYPYHKYTSKNTSYFELNEMDSLDCFVFSSELDCGGSMGSCGWAIQIFKKHENRFEIAFETCGFNLTCSKDTTYGFTTFTYEKKSGTKYKVYYDGDSFVEIPLSTTISKPE